MSSGVVIDRLAPRGRPPGQPVMHQRWNNLLFLHWAVAPNDLRPLIPSFLEIDTFGDQAYVGITPFFLDGLRHPLLPEIPGLNSFFEINVRTYVVRNGIPGLYFFSLDASRLLPVLAARIFFTLPYYSAEIHCESHGDQFNYSSRRLTGAGAEFKASWQVTGTRLRDPDKDSLAFFLVERYYAFAVSNSTVSAIRIYHHPWILEEATASIEKSTMLAAVGLQEPLAEPLIYFSRSIDAEIWSPEPV